MNRRRERARLERENAAIAQLEEELAECTDRCRRFLVSEPPSGFDPAGEETGKFDECEFGEEIRAALELGLLTVAETDELLRELKLQRPGAEGRARSLVLALGRLQSLPPPPPAAAPAHMLPQNCPTETEDIIARLVDLNAAEELSRDPKMVR